MSHHTHTALWWSLVSASSLVGCSSAGSVSSGAQTSEPRDITTPADESSSTSDSSAGTETSKPGVPSSSSSHAEPGETTAEDEPSGSGEGAPDSGPVPAPPRTEHDLCSGSLPASFTTFCAGCHTVSGASNDRYPDLYAFSGSIESFEKHVREGGNGMPAYSEDSITDPELSAIYAYFTSAVRSQPIVDSSGVEPLFSSMLEARLPIVFTRSDGVLVTRGAGRVRQRHEMEGTFNPYGPHYFEDRSFGIIVEDFTPTGESLIRVTYLPVGQPTPGTNFRAWKIYGDGNVFHANMGMDTGDLPSLNASGRDWSEGYAESVAPHAAVQIQKTTTNPRTGKPIAEGDLFEFEFGVFLEPSAVREGSRTSYYSDTFRYRVGKGGFTAENADDAGRLGPARPAQQGGDGTNVWLYEDEQFAFEQVALNVQHENVQRFLRGRRLFHTNFETGEHSEPGNPVFEEHVGKAGPRQLTTSCDACHVHNGPGRSFETFDSNASTTFKLYGGGELGNQLRLGDGIVRVAAAETKVVVFADGTTVGLSRPEFEVADNAGHALRYSPRLARKLIGLGLLEAIDDTTILARTDPLDCDDDGISGRAAIVPNPETGRLTLGRFGWKAEKVSVRHQVADALDADLGVGSPVFAAGGVELSESELADLTAYMRLLSVPAQRNSDDPAVSAGEDSFRRIGCASCHLTDVVTGNTHPFLEFREQSIKPYTDLLLHDMGEDLADASGLPEGVDTSPPGAREWRTPPLWGLGLYDTVNGNTRLLHDGRAANVTEAIVWHGGEASEAKENFMNLSAAERGNLVAFLESL